MQASREAFKRRRKRKRERGDEVRTFGESDPELKRAGVTLEEAYLLSSQP